MLKIIKSLRFRLLLLVLMAVIPALAISFWSGMEQRRLARVNAVEDAYRFTRLVVDYQSSLRQETEKLLLYLQTETQVSDPSQCAQVLRDTQAIYNTYITINLADLDGNIRCSSLQGAPATNIADRRYFQDALKTGKFVSGESVTGRLSKVGILPYAMPVRDEAGNITSVLVASVDLNQVLSYGAGMQLPAQSAILIVDDQGTVIARYPESETWLGKNLPNVPIIREILRANGEGSAETQGLDGVTRLYAFTPFRPSSQQNLFVSIGIPADIAYADAERLTRINLTWVGIASLLALAAAWFGGDVLFLRVVSLTAERDRAEKKLRDANATLEARVAERTEELALTNAQLQRELVERQRVVELLRQREDALRKNEKELRGLLHTVEQSNRDLQDFAYIASHDLQEPLRKIQAFSDRIQQRYGSTLGEEGLYFLERVSTSASRLQAMINALLSYSRVNTKGRDFVPTDLRAVIQNAVADLEIRLTETRGQVLVEDLPAVEADPLQMQQLFQNLIGNALKFHRDDVPPVVKISGTIQEAEENGHLPHLLISVTDNGIGFENKYLDKIFQPFQRLHGRDEYEGSGIGLAVCRKIVDRHHGTITATSEPHHGSCFLVKLPIKQSKKEEGE